MRNQIPQGWEMPLLGEVVRITQGNSKLTKKLFKSEGKYVAFSGSGPDGLMEDYEHEGKAIILSAVGARCGKCFKADGKWTAIANTAVIRSLLDQDILYDYFFYLLNNEDFWPKGGTAQPFVQTGLAQRETRIPLPPLNEQRRIVAKLEKLLTKVEACQERLNKIPTILNRFRQSVLAAACSGRLTADWQKHSQIESSNPTQEIADDLPNSWIWKPIRDLASAAKGSIQSGPFGSNLLHSEFQSTGILAIGIDNVLDGKFGFGRQHRISSQKYETLKKYAARPLDVLVTVMATVGRCCVVPADIETAIITKHVYRITINQIIVNPYFLMHCIR